MAHSINKTQIQVIFQETKSVRKVILNRPSQVNCLSYEMISQMLKRLGDYEKDPSTRLVILKVAVDLYKINTAIGKCNTAQQRAISMWPFYFSELKRCGPFYSQTDFYSFITSGPNPLLFGGPRGLVVTHASNLQGFNPSPVNKGNGRGFCSGGDVKAVISSAKIGSFDSGHWSFAARFFKKQLTLDYLLGTYNKPVVSILHGIVMGGGAGLSMHSSFRIVTENTIFAMPEAAFGAFPDCGASHFLSRLPGSFGEYLGLTGARLDGTEMLACGLATHFVLSKDIALLENELELLDTTIASGAVDIENISRIINKYARKGIQIRKYSAFDRLDVINQSFSLDTVEEILSSLEKLAAENQEKWMMNAIKSMNSVSPTSLKLFLRLIRQGRKQDLEQCLNREFKAACHGVRRTVNNDMFEGARALLFDKDKKPQWMPSKLEQVSIEMVEMYFSEVDDDDDWVPLELPARSSTGYTAVSKL